jgi:SAM-dependent methyltransferase
MIEKYKPSVQRDPTRLYSNKARVYAQSRPDYTPEALEAFQNAARIPPHAVVLDVGSGTGMLTRQLLEYYDTVYALEPTPEMRRIAENDLGDQPGFHSLDARAEDIPLHENSVDLIAAGQAIHWFEPEGSLRAFQRVAKPQTWLLLAHIKSMDEELNQAIGVVFSEEYGCLPQSEHPPSNLVPDSYYFADGDLKTISFPHDHIETWECFLGGIASAAYAPDTDHPLYNRFVQATRETFDNFSQDDLLTWKIATVLQFGHLAL